MSDHPRRTPPLDVVPEEDYQAPADEEAQPLLFLPQNRLYTTTEASRHHRPCEGNTRGTPLEGRLVSETWRTWDREKTVYESRAHAGRSRSTPHNHRRDVVLPAIVIMLLSISAILYALTAYSILSGASQPRAFDSSSQPPAIARSWAAYSPYFSAEPYTPPPSDCSIDQVNIIQRHGARFPTSGATTGIKAAVQKLQSATHYTDTRLNFLRNYTYTLGVNDLVPFGALQSQQGGQTTYERYSELISRKNMPFVRSSGGTRVVDSATNWTAGFSVASNHIFSPPVAVILPENLNDTLDDAMCPNVGSSDPQTDMWTAIYGAPIAARLNTQAPGANLVASDISSLIPLCAFETVVKMVASPFCALFTPAEFAEFEYFGDLDKFYGTGYGQPLGPVQGVGYINELLSRLTGLPVQDNTQTNRTLDASPLTFPLDRTLYVDFSHDNQMIAIYAAMGLFKQAKPLDPTRPDDRRTWVTSHLTPFSARMVTERMTCKRRHGNTVSNLNGASKSYVRILVNDALQPLDFCGGDRDGICELGAFVESQAYARRDGEGDFEKCFV